MAFDFSKFNVFTYFGKLGARARLVVLVGGVVSLVFIVYLGTRWIFGGGETVGPSRVATAPSGLQSVPGGKGMTAQYYQTLQQANVQAAQQARMTGQSAVPTLINIGDQSGNQCVICMDQSTSVKPLLDDWVRQNKIDRDVAQNLQKLADRNVPVDEFADMLNQLVKDGKLTPEQARLLLEQYRKQHANRLLQDSAKTMDDMIKAGQLPLDVANDLLKAQKDGATPAQYADLLQRLVREGKLTPDAAQRLLNQYKQQYAKEITAQSIAVLQRMGRNGELTPDILKDLIDLENQMVPLDNIDQVLKKYMAQGKLTPIVANKVLDEYKQQKAAIGPGIPLDEQIRRAEAAAYQELNDLLKAGTITQETAGQIRDMIQKNVPLDFFNTAIDQLVAQNKLTPAIGQQKKADYLAVKNLRDLSNRLSNLAANNATAQQYSDELKRAVQAGLITPEQAAQLLQDYQSMITQPTPDITPLIGGTPEFAALQQRVAAGAQQPPPPPTVQQFQVAAAPPIEVVQETEQQKQARLASLIGAMSGQAAQLVNAWAPPTIGSFKGSAKDGKDCKPPLACPGQATVVTGAGTATGTAIAVKGPLIKAGTILFGVLDTAVNSDYPDTPVMVTIVDGRFKGAKLLGRLATAKNVAGQLDRVSLNFNLMNMDEWPISKSVTAFAIDPDTARTVLATSVNYHYLLRYGSLMASAFLTGYATAITTSGSTSTTGIFGTSTTYPELDPRQKIFAALGQVGTQLGQATQQYFNIPPTVRVDAGVSLGILFMADVTEIT
jgi:polyhydroxyalkanoate synthesis regulator phasin